MGRSGIAFAVFGVLLIFLVGILPGCSSGSAVHTASYAVPASVTLVSQPVLILGDRYLPGVNCDRFECHQHDNHRANFLPVE